MRKLIQYFYVGEWLLWSGSCLAILVCFFLFDGSDVLTLIASLVGVSSLILCAKGNPAGQVLMLLFSLLYGYISLTFAYYGEMITYLGMTAPMALFSLISWLRHPYKGQKSQVQVAAMRPRDWLLALFLTLGVTVAFYFILRALDTANLIPSTVSVTTSFLAAYLTWRRSPYFALIYAANDAVLLVLWTLASFSDHSYISVVVCFAAFLVNDLYGFISWKRMQKRQRDGEI
ncbi:MAG: nicotinamide mononucleotide transporter [Clostridia bacterium]|nr:nicotinamide mononucleotide transporter [Clostridia bacterium]MBQ5793156.1 nicotinamide mononucleotide transporter [Clostridia bacterium]